MNVLHLLNPFGRDPLGDTVRALVSPWLFGLADETRPDHTDATDHTENAEESPSRDTGNPHDLAS